MGWSSYGYVFTRQPNWDRLGQLPLRAGGVVGFKHRTSDVWLVGFAGRRDRGAEAFVFHPPVEFAINRGSLDSGTRELLARVDAVAEVLDTEFLGFTVEWLTRTLAVAERAEVPAFFFTADDEFLDVGCRVEPGRVVEFAGRFPDFSLRSLGAGLRLLVPDCDSLSSFPAERLEGVKAVDGTEVVVRRDGKPVPLPRARGAGRPRRSVSVQGDLAKWGVFYRFPVELWPVEAGDPGAILGLGTWDLFDGFDRDFDQVFPPPLDTGKARRTRRCT